MKEEKKRIEVVPVEKIKVAGFDRKAFIDLIRARNIAADEEKQAKLRKEQYDKELRTMLIKAKIKHRVGVDESAVMMCKGVNKYVDPVLLMENGVKASVIDKSTRESEYVYISAVKWEESEES